MRKPFAPLCASFVRTVEEANDDSDSCPIVSWLSPRQCVSLNILPPIIAPILTARQLVAPVFPSLCVFRTLVKVGRAMLALRHSCDRWHCDCMLPWSKTGRMNQLLWFVLLPVMEFKDIQVPQVSASPARLHHAAIGPKDGSVVR